MVSVPGVHDHQAHHMQAHDTVWRSACSIIRHGSDSIALKKKLLAGAAKLVCRCIRVCMKP